MNRLALLSFAPLCICVCSCGLAGKVIQAPVRLIEAGVRTVSDAKETATPAVADAARTRGLAIQSSVEIASRE